MNNDKDWEELEKWNENRIQQERKKYKIDYDKINKRKEKKKVEHVVKGLKITGNFLKAIIIIVIIIGIYKVSIISYVNFKNMRRNVDFSVIESIENMYNVKTKIVSQDIVDEKGNGVYKLELEDNSEIKFTAIQETRKGKEDFLDNSHKYYFDKWNSPNKKYFIVNENTENEILDYSTYIEINSYEDLEKSTNMIIEFAEFCGPKFYPSWNIYLEKDNERIYPYSTTGMSKEDVIKKAKELYKEKFN